MRDYLQHLERSNALTRITREVDPRFELAAVTRAFQQRGDAALLFEKVRGTGLPVATNLYGSQGRLLDIIGAGELSFCRAWAQQLDRFEAQPSPPPAAVAKPADLVTGQLSDLPLLTYHEKDAGPYLTAGIFLARHPDTGIANLSFHRCMVVSDRELRVRLGDTHDLTAYYRRAETRDEALEAAILVGVPPAVFMAACASLPEGADELALANQLAEGQLATFPGASVDLPIPVGTQVVIEGRILPHERRAEGPFGEFLGYYVPEGQNPVFEVSAVHWQPDAVFHSILCGSAEDRVPLQAINAAKTFRHLDARLPGIVDVSCAPGFMNTTISIRQAYEGHARQVLLAAFSADTDYNKLCIVVDEDDDADKIDDVIRAFVSRGRIDHRTLVIEDVPGFYRDPHRDHWGRVGLDATRPFGRAAEFDKKRVPGEQDIKPEDYL